MRVSVLEPWKALFEGNVEQAVLPGEDGELCVLDFHHPFLQRLRKGVIQLTRAGAHRGVRLIEGQPARVQIPVTDGVARMSGNELVILVDTTRTRGAGPSR